MDFNLAGARMNGRSLDIQSPSLDRYTVDHQLQHASGPPAYRTLESSEHLDMLENRYHLPVA